MAGLSDLENGVVNVIAAALFTSPYTNYTVQTSDPLNIPIRLMRGWPVDSQLNTDLKNGVTSISVFSAPNVARQKTKFLTQSTTVTTFQAAATMTLTLSGSVVTFAGTASTSEVIGIGVRGRKYGYSMRLSAGQTPTQVASQFAANLPGATSVGPLLTVAAPSNQIVIETGGDVTSWTEVSRTTQMMMVTVWAPTVDKRDLVCNYIDPQLLNVSHLEFADNSVSEPILGAGTLVDDVVEKEFMWKRTMYYCITYPIGFTETLPIMVLGKEFFGDSITLID